MKHYFVQLANGERSVQQAATKAAAYELATAAYKGLRPLGLDAGDVTTPHGGNKPLSASITILTPPRPKLAF